MPERKCPVCEIKMESKKYPDITIDECPRCGGICLDKNELNALATGIAGDIEHMTADDIDNNDEYPNRKCPNCTDTTMRKMELLGYSGTVFDYCEECDCFFLDKDELPKMNSELTRLSQRKLPEEFRGEINGYLIRKDRSHVAISRGSGPIPADVSQPAFYVRISAYFKRPLDVGLRITSEGMMDKVTKMLKINQKHDITVGNDRLDKKAIIQADAPESAKALLQQETVANAVIHYIDHKPRIFTYATKFEILDDSISCIGGPYSERLNYNPEEDPENVVENLIAVAKAIDSRE